MSGPVMDFVFPYIIGGGRLPANYVARTRFYAMHRPLPWQLCDIHAGWNITHIATGFLAGQTVHGTGRAFRYMRELDQLHFEFFPDDFSIDRPYKLRALPRGEQFRCLAAEILRRFVYPA